MPATSSSPAAWWHDWKKYGGWGIRRSSGGVWAYVPTSAKRAVLLHYRNDEGVEKKVVFAARGADGVARTIQLARGVGARFEDEAGAEDEVLADIEAAAAEGEAQALR